MLSFKSDNDLAMAAPNHKPVWFCLPQSFDPAEFLLTPRLAARADDARFFVSTILYKFARRDVDKKGLVRLKAAFVRKIMHNRLAKEIVDALIHGGAIKRPGNYIKGKCSFGYRLASRYLADPHIRIPATDPAL